MSLTVYAEGKGFFHKGSGGSGVAPGDVCLSPPPPPTGPAPIPYVNSLSAGDLTKGSTTVKIDGNPTALSDKSYVATSTGDEGGTQGGNVITHKTKGKGYFKTWSFNVFVQGEGVACHDDMMGQNCTSTPPGCVDMKAVTSFLLRDDVKIKPCDKPYKRRKSPKSPTPEQTKHVAGGPCWECARDLHKSDWSSITVYGNKVVAKASAYLSGLKDNKNFVADHQPPLSIAWYLGGCHMGEEAFWKWADEKGSVKPHCKAHSNSQRNTVGNVVRGKRGAAAIRSCIRFLWG